MKQINKILVFLEENIKGRTEVYYIPEKDFKLNILMSRFIYIKRAS